MLTFPKIIVDYANNCVKIIVTVFSVYTPMVVSYVVFKRV